jgi:hypothetical protein
VQFGFNEADTFKSSSTLMYYQSEQGLCTQNGWHDADVIKAIKSDFKYERVKLINIVEMK